MAHFANNGERLYKSLVIKVQQPGTSKMIKSLVRAESGRGMNSDYIEKVLVKIADDLEKKFPEVPFRLVPLGPTAFNFTIQQEIHV